jgi:hypothetical protein
MRTQVAGARRGLGAVMAALLVSVVLTPGAEAAAVGQDAIGIGQDPGAVCVNGWATAGSPSAVAGSTATDVTVQNGTQWVAGSANQEGPTFVAYTARSTATGWSTVPVGRNSLHSLLTGISTSGTIGLWAAGEDVEGSQTTQPLIEHYNGKAWSRSPLPRLRYGGALSDITQVNPQVAIAVGFGADLKGQHAVAYAWRRGRWGLASPSVAGFSALTGIATAPDRTTWAVGWIQTRSGFRPLLERWNGSGWTRANIAGDGSVVLTGVAVISKSNAWATGFREEDGMLSGIVVHFNGRSWAVDDTLQITASGSSILRGVALVNGNITAVGEQWDQENGYKDSLPVVAERVGTTWTTNVGVAGITGGELLGIAGGLNPIAVGRTSGRAVAIVPCTPGHTPSTGAVGSPAVSVGVQGGGASADPAPAGSSVDSTTNGSAIEGGSAPQMSTVQGRGQAVRRRIPVVTRPRSLPTPQSVAGLQVIDATQSAGLAMNTLVYNAVAADLNGDGWSDLVISRRARPLWVLLNEGDGQFETVNNPFRQADRHGCAVGQLDQSPDPAIVCAIGASHGLGIKDNEVWLAPLDPSQSNAADQLGLADPLGRGRQTALLDYNHDGKMDVYFGNDPSRPDALPGSNHLFRNVDGTSFEPAPGAGLNLGVGSQCLVPVDIDRDGWTDLINCEYIPMAAYAALHVYHNNHGVFSDVTTRLGIDGKGVYDAVAGDLNHDGKVDIVTLAPGRMDIWIQQNHTFHREASFWVSAAAAVTLADVNGDHRPDIYIVRGERSGGSTRDVLLLNNGNGINYRSVKLPSAPPGPGGDAVAIDYDQNGKQDLLVMHGNNVQEGPIQLLAFGPPWPFGVPSAPTPTPTPTPSPGGTSSPSLSPASSGAPSPSASGSNTPSASGSNPPSSSAAPSPSAVGASPSAVGTPPRSATPSATAPGSDVLTSPSPSASASPTVSPSPRASATAVSSPTPHSTPSPSPTPSPTAQPTPTATRSPGRSPGKSPGHPAGPTPSSKPSASTRPSPTSAPRTAPPSDTAPASEGASAASPSSGPSPGPSASPSPSVSNGPSAKPSAAGAAASSESPTEGIGVGSVANGSGGSNSGAASIAGLDEGGVVRTVTLFALGLVGLFFVAFQLFGRRNRGR